MRCPGLPVLSRMFFIFSDDRLIGPRLTAGISLPGEAATIPTRKRSPCYLRITRLLLSGASVRQILPGLPVPRIQAQSVSPGLPSIGELAGPGISHAQIHPHVDQGGILP